MRVNRGAGFTLVELMVTLSVLAIIAALALPSFLDFAERSALRGAADSVVQLIGTARTESIKRNQMVRVDFRAAGSAFCVGAAPVATTGGAGCDCTAAAACPVAEFPGNAEELESLMLDGTPTFGSDTAFVVDPTTGMLVDVGDAGSVDLTSPRGYGVRVSVNVMGRASLCTPSGKRGISGVGPCA